MPETPDRPEVAAEAVGSQLLIDLYELTMLQAYWREQMHAPATFSLFVRRLPGRRNFLLACGLDAVLADLEDLQFDTAALDHLAGLGTFSDDFLRWLGGLRFTGSVRAAPEGTPVFAGEPILEVTAPIGEAQILETLLLNRVHLQTLIASKAARVVHAASGRRVIDFGMRRMHGADASLAAARACWIAGVAATSNVEAGRRHGIPVAGTMAHSYVQAHADEAAAFDAFSDLYPDTVLLLDTYDTLAAVDSVIALARRRGTAFRIDGVRLDSGDMAALSRQVRKRLNAAGLAVVKIYASGGLDEDRIAALLVQQAPIDGFGVGTRMGVSADVPALDIVYKLVEYAGEPRYKLSHGKVLVPGAKQVFRREADGCLTGDVIAGAGEKLPGRPLLETVMQDGRRTPAGCVSLRRIRKRAAAAVARLPDPIRSLDPPSMPYPVTLSPALEASLRRSLRP